MSMHHLIMGVHAVRELLQSNPLRLKTVYTSSKQSDLISQCEKKGIPVAFKSSEQLTKMVGTDSHQSIVALTTPRSYLSLKEFFVKERECSTVLMIDQIFDPQNFGALLRSAECFGIDAVIFSKNRGSEVTPTVTKVSCGASEIIPLIRVSNLAEAVSQFQERGYEAISTVLSADAKPLTEFTFSPKTLLIAGSEGKGIQPLIQKRSDHKLFIPISGKTQSLNVAQATTLFLYSATLKKE